MQRPVIGMVEDQQPCVCVCVCVDREQVQEMRNDAEGAEDSRLI